MGSRRIPRGIIWEFFAAFSGKKVHWERSLKIPENVIREHSLGILCIILWVFLGIHSIHWEFLGVFSGDFWEHFLGIPSSILWGSLIAFSGESWEYSLGISKKDPRVSIPVNFLRESLTVFSWDTWEHALGIPGKFLVTLYETILKSSFKAQRTTTSVLDIP